MSSEIHTMLSERTIELAPGNKGFFIYTFIIHKENEMSSYIMNLKPINQFITFIQFKMTTIILTRETIYLSH